jgi:hypothetical protein
MNLHDMLVDRPVIVLVVVIAFGLGVLVGDLLPKSQEEE